jgi:hypothetical protein
MRTLMILALTGFFWLPLGCEPCLESGKHGVPDPEPHEYQLVFDNVVSRNTPVFVDGEEIGTVCEETNDVTLGNFPVDTCSIIMARSQVSGTDCYFSPNCTNSCDSQECTPDACADTTPFAGDILHVRLIWQN